MIILEGLSLLGCVVLPTLYTVVTYRLGLNEEQSEGLDGQRELELHELDAKPDDDDDDVLLFDNPLLEAGASPRGETRVGTSKGEKKKKKKHLSQPYSDNSNFQNPVFGDQSSLAQS